MARGKDRKNIVSALVASKDGKLSSPSYSVLLLCEFILYYHKKLIQVWPNSRCLKLLGLTRPILSFTVEKLKSEEIETCPQ
jgi:hypothetical protein